MKNKDVKCRNMDCHSWKNGYCKLLVEDPIQPCCFYKSGIKVEQERDEYAVKTIGLPQMQDGTYKKVFEQPQFWAEWIRQKKGVEVNEDCFARTRECEED